MCGLFIASTPNGVCKIDFIQNEKAFFRWINRNFKESSLVYRKNSFEHVILELKQYFNGQRKTFSIKIDLIGTQFQKMVWEKISGIPYGSTMSYKQIAQEVGGIGCSRAVGNASHRNPIPIIIPCHRVIGSDGSLTGYAGGLEIKKKLLELERNQNFL